ncbi:MAG: chorismate mutase [Clostridium sp.]
MKSLDICREEINEVDKAIVVLFEKRMELALDVARYKLENKLPILNEIRENEVIKKNKEYLQNKCLEEAFERFMNEIMSISRELQNDFISINS